MKTLEIKGNVREQIGKNSSADLRKEGLVPSVLYGGDAPIHFSTPLFSFKQLVYTPDAYLVKLDIDGKSYDAILQDAQFHPVSEDIIHSDFLAISKDSPVTIQIPVKTFGRSKGVLAGGGLSIIIRKLKVRAIPANLPDVIMVDMTDIDLGGAFKVKDLVLPEGVVALNQPNSVIAGVKVTRTARLAANAEK